MGVRVLVEWIAAGLVAGQLLAAHGWWTGDAGFAVAVAVVAVTVAWSAATGRLAALVPAAAIAAALGGGTLVARTVAVPDDADHVARLTLPLRARVEGRVIGRPVVDPSRTTLVLDVTRVGSRPRTRGRVRLRVRRGAAPVAAGDLIAVETTLRRARNFANPGGYDLEAALARRGVHVTASVWDPTTIERLEPGGGRTGLALAGWRRTVRDGIDRAAACDAAAVLRALALGDESAIDAGLRDAFVRTGVVHVLSVSGLHVGIVAAAAGWVAAWLLGRSERMLLRVDRRKAAVVTGLGAAVVYAALTGFAVATVRAVLMAAVVACAVVGERSAEPLRALALAAIVICASQPGAPAEISFQLSFVSVAALVGGAGRAAADDGRPVWIRRAVRASAAAWIGTAPLTAFHFHQVSLVSVLANPLVLPLFEAAALVPALAGALVAPVAPWLADLAFAGAALPVRIAVEIVRVLAAWPWAAVDVPLPNVVELLLVYAALVGMCCRRRPTGRLVATAALLGLAADAAWWACVRTGAAPRATFLDVGQGDAAVLELTGGRVVVVDAGGFPGSDFDTGAALVEPFLRARKIQRVDAMVVSHAHPDHAAGLAHLVRRFRPAELWWSGHGAVGSAWDALAAALRETATPARTLAAGDEIPGFPEVAVVHPPRGWTPRSLNDDSLVLRVGVGSASVLLTGDAERAAEEAMLAASGRLPAVVLKVPHHGSRTSSLPRFVAAVAPRVAVASMGADNRFGHPAPEVVARYAAAGAALYRTDRCGAVTIAPDAAGVRVWTARPCGGGVGLRTPPPP